MSIFYVARWRSTRGMVDWLCNQERWNTEVTTIIGASARYRQAKVCSSHDDAHPGNSALHTGTVRPRTTFVGCLFFLSPRTGYGSS